MFERPHVHIVGGGLAGSEAAWQILKNSSAQVTLHEMRPLKMTEAHKTQGLAELVCSNSFKSMGLDSASGCLKEEMKQLDSLIIDSGFKASVPAGKALAVDRLELSRFVEERLRSDSRFELQTHEIIEIPNEAELINSNSYYVIASGPLTHGALYQELMKLCGDKKSLHFYDAIAPVIASDTINFEECFKADRYQKEEDDLGDYLNLPMSKEHYETFIDDVLGAEMTPLHHFEDTGYFESCLPIEVMAERGRETLRFGPLKPVGLVDPRTGKIPYACVQLRQENKEATMYSMVGFQTKMKWGEQKRVFSKLPGLHDAEILRYGSIHRNTYVQSAQVLSQNFSFRLNSRVFLAGQLTGVEGYVESAAIGLMVGRIVAAHSLSKDFKLPPKSTVLGALVHYVLAGESKVFSPMNCNLGLLPALESIKKTSKQERRLLQCQRAIKDFESYAKVNLH